MRHVETGCRDCRKCTNSGMANAGRNFVKVFLAFMTLGMSAMAMSFRKKCRVCGHQLSLHSAR